MKNPSRGKKLFKMRVALFVFFALSIALIADEGSVHTTHTLSLKGTRELLDSARMNNRVLLYRIEHKLNKYELYPKYMDQGESQSLPNN